jgi:hypothetical protein
MDERIRREYVEKVKSIPAENLVYVDETGIDQYLYREYARAPRGQKVIVKISGRRFKRTNIVAGLCLGKWVSPLAYTGTTDSVLFEFWFEKHLLREVKKGTIIVLDNARFHRKSVLPDLAKRYGCEVLFLPPYSPDLNPIEFKWAWVKQRLRKGLFDFDCFELALWDTFNVN